MNQPRIVLQILGRCGADVCMHPDCLVHHCEDPRHQVREISMRAVVGDEEFYGTALLTRDDATGVWEHSGSAIDDWLSNELLDACTHEPLLLDAVLEHSIDATVREIVVDVDDSCCGVCDMPWEQHSSMQRADCAAAEASDPTQEGD